MQDDLTSTREASTRTAVHEATRSYRKAEELTKALEQALSADFDAKIRPLAVHTMQVGNATYKKNNEGKFEKVGGRKTAQKSGKSNPVLFEIANNANCVISGETLDGVSFSCTCKLQFL